MLFILYTYMKYFWIFCSIRLLMALMRRRALWNWMIKLPHMGIGSTVIWFWEAFSFVLIGPAAFRPRAHAAASYTPSIENGRPVLHGLLAIDYVAKEVSLSFFFYREFLYFIVSLYSTLDNFFKHHAEVILHLWMNNHLLWNHLP